MELESYKKKKSQGMAGSSQEVTKCRRVTEKHGVKGHQSKVLVSPGSAR